MKYIKHIHMWMIFHSLSVQYVWEWPGFCQDLQRPCREPTLPQSVPGGLTLEGILTEVVCENCSSRKGLTLQNFMKDCLLWQGPHAAAGKHLWRVLPMRRKEQKRQCVLNWPQRPFPCPLPCLQGGGRQSGCEVEPGKKGRMEGKRWGLGFGFFLINLLWFWLAMPWINSPSWVCFPHNSKWWVISPVFIPTHKPFILFSLPFPAEETEWLWSLHKQTGLTKQWSLNIFATNENLLNTYITFDTRELRHLKITWINKINILILRVLEQFVKSWI